jgi:hypothetical protein
VESWHLQGCSPRLCQLRTDGLAPQASIERTDRMLVIWPSKPSSMSSIDAWLCPYCFIGWLGRETGYGPVDRSANVSWIVSGAHFLRSSGLAQLC